MQSIVDIEDKIPDPTSDIARGFYFQGTKKIGVLLIHGFTGTPAEMRQLGEFLYKKGYTVRCDPLPGHCTSPEDLKKTKWQDWVNAALKWIKEMKVEHEKIFVAGLSLGSLITAYLAEESKEINGIIIMSSPIIISGIKAKLAKIIKILKRPKVIERNKKTDLINREVILKMPHYPYYYLDSVIQVFELRRIVKDNLKKIRIPTLIIHGDNDATCPTKSAEYVYDHIGTLDVHKKLVIIHSGHVLTMDINNMRVFNEIVEFIKRYSKSNSPLGEGIMNASLLEDEK